MKEKTVAVMFSGGVDSSYATWTQIPEYERIHLVTFIRTGFRKKENLQDGISRFQSVFPQKEIIHSEVDFEDIYQKISPHKQKLEIQQAVLSQTISPLWEDPQGNQRGKDAYKQDMKNLFIANECLQCKIAMELAALKFCQDNSITDICDGANNEQLDDGSQLESVKSTAREIFKQCGINFFSPTFHVAVEERCRALFDAGIIDTLDHKRLEKQHKIPSRQIQCTVPSSVLWTTCIFPWMVYDGESCNDYINLCHAYFLTEMEKGLKTLSITC